MTFSGQEPRRGRAFPLLALVGAVALLLAISLTWAGAKEQPRPDPAPCAQGEGLSSACRALAEQAATPVVAEPLDGDPLDGEPAATDDRPRRRLPDPDNATALAITQSGRQKDTPNSTVLYDGNDATIWTPGDLPEAWVWFDLGDAEQVRNIRWLAEGDGEVEVSISSDHRTWAVLDTLPVEAGWQEITLREDAQYVRLTLLPDDATEPVALAEVEVFGRERKADAELAQDANDRQKKREQRRAAKRAQQAASDDAASDASGDGGGRNSEPEISTRPGKTKCSGSRERCRAKPGRVEVNDDCDGNGTCTIDIRADGGSATCDASGGSKNKAGKGEGRRNYDNGGRCEATANGGSVTIGDVDP
ncbi:MAG: discoidin domain-containing protein [Thermomicrobiales bacterium]